MMQAMVLTMPGQGLQLWQCPIPQPQPDQVLLRVTACGICRTDLHIVDGELTQPKLPLIPGHQIVGVVEQLGAAVNHLAVGDRVGVPWLGKTCGTCGYCAGGRENLCDRALFTGYQLDGGYAEYTVADASFCFQLSETFSDLQAAPLLCAGLIGYRSLRMTEGAQRLGLYGFGAAAHIILQVAKFQGRQVFAFTRPQDTESQQFAKALGADWVGSSMEHPPAPLDAAIIFAPVGALVPAALKAVAKGGIVVCAGIHMSDIPSFAYELLWGERVVRSVANLTRQDGTEFLALAPQIPIQTTVTTYPLAAANEALNDLRQGTVQGSAVLRLSSTL